MSSPPSHAGSNPVHDTFSDEAILGDPMTSLQKTEQHIRNEFAIEVIDAFAEYGYVLKEDQLDRLKNAHVCDLYSVAVELWHEWEQPMKGTCPIVPNLWRIAFGLKNYEKCEGGWKTIRSNEHGEDDA